VLLDGQAGAAYDSIIPNGPTFYPDGVLEFLAIKDNSLYRVRYIPTP
jgi:hypothetical protein